MSALVDFPIAEAEALLKRTGPDGVSMSAAECDAAEQARKRIAQAVAVERGAGGNDAPSPGELVAELAENLIGQRIRVETAYGSTICGKLERVVGFRSLMIIDEHARRPINASLVRSIELEAAA